MSRDIIINVIGGILLIGATYVFTKFFSKLEQQEIESIAVIVANNADLKEGLVNKLSNLPELQPIEPQLPDFSWQEVIYNNQYFSPDYEYRLLDLANNATYHITQITDRYLRTWNPDMISITYNSKDYASFTTNAGNFQRNIQLFRRKID